MLSVGARSFLGVTLPPLKHFGPLLVVWGAAMVMLVFIRDLGSSLMFFGAFLALLYVATARLFLRDRRPGDVPRRRLRSCAQNVAHVQDRFDIWLDPFAQGRAARARARSRSRCSPRPTAGSSAPASASRCSSFPGPFFPDSCKAASPTAAAILPAPHTDFIYAVIVNELGLFGGAAA